MQTPLILASGSSVRVHLLRQAQLGFSVFPARIDEQSIRESMLDGGASTREIAATLADHKALKISKKDSEALVLGCDQVLDFQGKIVSKPSSQENALEQLASMRGSQHVLFSAAALYKQCKPIWRHVGKVKMHMRASTNEYLAGYVQRNWESIKHSAGSYKLEEEGVRLFTRIEGDYFNVLGLPLFELLSYLESCGELEI